MNEALFKLLGVCLVGAVVCISLKPHAAQYSFLISVSAGAVAIIFILKDLAIPITQINEQLTQIGAAPEYFKIALKAVGISYISSFVADACRESGQTLLATSAETAGKCAILYLSFPLILSISEAAVGFIT